MAKEVKRKLLFVTVFLIALLSFSAYASLPSVYALESASQESVPPISIPETNVTRSAIEEKGLQILSSVVGVDLTKYTITSAECAQDSYMDVVPQETVRYVLESN